MLWLFRGAVPVARPTAWSWALALVLGAGLWSTGSWADSQKFQACIVSAAQYRNVDPILLKAIAYQESRFRLDAVNHNRDKNGRITSTDHGPFQINDQWLPRLKKQGITVEQLYEECVPAYVAAWLLASAIKQHGSTWRAVGSYNSPSEANRKKYANLVKGHYERFLSGQR